MQAVAFKNAQTLFLREAHPVESGRDVAVLVGTERESLFTIVFRERFSGLLFDSGAEATLHAVSSMWNRRIAPLLSAYVGEADPLEKLRGIRVVCEDESSQIESSSF